MKITCDVIRDLLPLYAENIANDDTKALIEEHLEGCEPCMEKLQEMRQTQTIPNNVENEFIGKMKSNSVRVILNISLVIGIFLAIANLIYICLVGNIGFMEFEELDIEFTPVYRYETADNSKDGYVPSGHNYSGMTMENLQESLRYNDETFDENNITQENLSVEISGGFSFSSSNVTKVKQDNGKYIYYIEAYKRLYSKYETANYQMLHSDIDFDYTEEPTNQKIDDYVEAVYVATPNKDYLVYGNDVATEKFDVSYPFFLVHIFSIVIIILSIVCLVLRISRNKSGIAKYIDVISMAMMVLLLNSMFILNFISIGWHSTEVYSYYLVLNALPLALVVADVIMSLYAIYKNLKTHNIRYNLWSIAMFVAILYVLYYEMIRVFEWITFRISFEYLYIFYPVLPLILLGIFGLGYCVYKNDTLKPKQYITKSYKFTQGILILNLIALQNYSFYIFSLKNSLIGQSVYKEGKVFFLDNIFFADILNMTSKLIIIYAFYCLIKHKNYLMLGIILQAIALCMEKGMYFHLHLENINSMEDLSFHVFVLSYLMIGLTMFINKRLLQNKLSYNKKEEE